MKFILGNKMQMTQIWVNDKVAGVTPIKVSPCFITQIKTKAIDGYDALQIGTGFKKDKNIKKPLKNHLAKAGQPNLRHLREMRPEVLPEIKIGDQLSLETFATGDLIDVTAISKGKGFAGVVKRHGFHGFRKTHGNKDQERHSGSIGPKGPAHVFKGMKMGGQMGNEQVTTKNNEIASVDTVENIIYIKGAVPGPISGLVIIKGKGDLKIFEAPVEAIVEAPVEVEVNTDETTVEEIKKSE